MTRETLDIFGIGLSLPQAHRVREVVAAAGGDPSEYGGWEHVCIAEPDQHPSTFAAQALKAALAESGVSPDELKLVISTGVSRDYLPSWSISAEVMRLLAISDRALGIDITVGCLAGLIALQQALGWLMLSGGGYAAIVNAERWSYTVNRVARSDQGLWAHADGGSALVVGLGQGRRSLCRFEGARFVSHSAYNGLILVNYGGTRNPIAPADVSPFTRQVRDEPPRQIWATYRAGYERAIGETIRHFGVAPARVVCNQISPKIVSMIGEVAGVPEERICRTGPEYGHVGVSDVPIGLRRLIDGNMLDGPVLITGSTPYAFGAGIISPMP